MLMELPEIEIPDASGWNIELTSELARADMRSFIATPKERLVVDYVTVERYREQLIDAVYPAEIAVVRAQHFWIEEKQEWSKSISIGLYLLNPRTMKRYSDRNPLSAMRYVRDGDVGYRDELPTSREKIKRVILSETTPTTRIIVTITEEPLHA